MPKPCKPKPKPRISPSRIPIWEDPLGQRRWVCHGDGLFGFGADPIEAYLMFSLRREAADKAFPPMTVRPEDWIPMRAPRWDWVAETESHPVEYVAVGREMSFELDDRSKQMRHWLKQLKPVEPGVM